MSFEMVKSLLKANWLTLVRDKLALFLTFLLPMIFFAVFAVIFGGMGGGGSSQPADLQIAILDLDESEASTALTQSLLSMDSVAQLETEAQLTEDTAIRLVRTGKADATVIFPEGLGDSVGSFVSDRPAIRVIYDPANPVAANMLSGVLQGAAFTAMPTALLDSGMKQFRAFGGPMSPQQELAIQQMDQWLGAQANGAESGDESSSSDSNGGGFDMANGLVRIDSRSVRDIPASDEKTDDKPAKVGSMISYYAASVAVMFLMFSMAGAASALLESQENGTLDRMISGQLTVGMLVFSQWLYFVLIGVAQLLIMFVFAWLVFGVEFSRPPVVVGTVIMSVVTAMASAAFIMLLATLCRSRKQLESVSTTIILIMSAFGGSMIPRAFLPSFVRETSKITFSGWALDGFMKVLWYFDPTQSLFSTIGVHVVVIVAMAAAFLFIAMRTARKWAVA